ncbi:MAG: glycosyltransferase [Bacilli bacterium]
MKVIFLGNALNYQTVKSNKNISTVSYADNQAQINLIKEFNKYYKEDFKVITAAYNNDVTLKHKEENVLIGGANCLAIKNYSGNKIIYYLSIIIGYTKQLNRLLKQYKGEKIIVITNGPHAFRTLPILFTRKRFDYIFIPFLVGAVELPELKGLDHIVASFSPKLLKMADGTITYVKNSAVLYTKKPYVEILYSLNEKDFTYKEKKEKKESDLIKILFTGALNDINSIPVLINLIKISPKNYRFIICGSGQYENELQNLSKTNSKKVKFLGLINHDKVIELQHQVDYLIILRNKKDDFGLYHSKYSMSSKLFEYLLSGTPVIVNDHEAMQKEIRPYLNIIKNTEPDTIINLIENPPKDLKAKSKKGQKFVIDNAKDEIQMKKVINFINKF